jgi:hypothetical protein
MAGFNHGQYTGATFYDPTSPYGGQNNPPQFGMGWAQSQAAVGPGGYFEQNPQAAWTRRTGGVDPFSAKGQNLQGLWGQVQRGFDAARASNPLLTIVDYVGGLDPTQLYNAQTQQQRGETPGRFAPRARTISRAYGG